MATLILEHQGKQRGGVLNGRISIGRQAGSDIVIDDESVSRVHAWIGRVGHTYFLADGGSRTGTIVNGHPVAGRRTLRDGDQIRIGPAKLYFHSDAPLPPGIEPLITEPAPPPAPIHVRTISEESRPRPASADSAPGEITCGACQSAIGPKEPPTSCTECGVTFHANCWIENRGCSSYGCKHVGILDPVKAPAKPVTGHAAVAEIELAEDSRRVQWSYVLLPASGLAGLAGMFAFGIPSLALLIGLIFYSTRGPARRRWVFAGSQMFSAMAATAGAAFSTYWWLLPAAGMVRR